MAEKEDPFEAALSELGNENLGENGAESAENDPSATGNGDAGFAKDSETTGGDQAVDPFDSAMAELDTDQNAEAKTETPDSSESDDPFAAALAIAKSEHKISEEKKTVKTDSQAIDLDFLLEVKLDLTFEVGRTKMYITDLLSLGQGSVIELHRLVGEELELFVNGRILATGEVVVVNEKFGARITKILSPEERINRLGPFLGDNF